MLEGQVLGGEPDEIGIDVGGEEFDDDGGIGGGAGEIGAIGRGCACWQWRACRIGGALAEILGGSCGSKVGDGGVEGGEGFRIGGDDAEGDEIHGKLQGWGWSRGYGWV